MRATLANNLKVLVPLKRTIDYAVQIRINTAKTAVETKGVKHSINPFDEIAVEESIRLREKNKDLIEKITVASIGPGKTTEALQRALAMGADDAVLVETKDDAIVEPLAVAKTLAAIAKEQSSDLIILGKQAIDDDSGQVGSILSGLLDWPIANFASKVDIEGNNVQVVREIDGGLETVKFQTPAVITTDLRLNEPRYATLPNIMKAKKKPLTKKKPEDYSVDITPRLEYLKANEPPKRTGGQKVDSVDALISAIKDKGLI